MGLKETRKKAMALMVAACVAGTSTTPAMGADLDVLFTDNSGVEESVFSSGENRIQTVKVGINFYDPAKGEQVAEPSIEVREDVTEISREEIEKLLPEGYKLADKDAASFAIVSGYVYVEVTDIETAKEIAIYYYCEEDGFSANGKSISVEGSATEIDISAFTDIPNGYEIDEVASNIRNGKISINPGNQIQVVLKKIVNTKTTFYFIFKTEDGKTVGFDTAEFPSETYNINYNDLQKLNMVPEGYELCNSGDLCIDGATDKNNPVIVEVRKVEKEISIIYQTRAGKVVKTDTISVAADAIHINTSLLQAPTGYTIAIVGDLAITKDNKVYVTLDVAQKTISIVYKTLNGNIVKNQNMTVGYYTKYINADKLNAPSGYEIVSSGKLKITNNTVNVFVKAINKTITVYYKTSPTKVVKTEQLKVSGTAKKISVANLNLPKNYRLATNAKTFVIKKGDYVNVPVKLDTRKDVNTLRITCGKIFVYTGKAITPSVTIKDSWKTLKLGKDYTISYHNNIKRGKATIIVKGIGNYKGQKVLSFLIR